MNRRDNGFTLIEIVIVLTILGIVFSAAISGLRLKQNDFPNREVIDNTVKMVQFLRLRAMQEQQPYQLVLDYGAFYALRYFHPYDEGMPMADYLALREQEAQRIRDEIAQAAVQISDVESDTPLVTAVAGAEAATNVSQAARQPEVAEPPGTFFMEKLTWPPELKVSVLFWGESRWLPLDGTLSRRWVFQPSGLCDPIQLRFENQGHWSEIGFDALTGELRSERHGEDT